MTSPSSSTDDRSYAERLASMPPADRARILEAMTDEEATKALTSWPFLARPKQLPPPGDWSVCIQQAGRGAGKTRSIVEWGQAQAKAIPGSRGVVAGRTVGDCRETLIEGESGFLAVAPPDFRPKYEPSKRRLTWPNGSRALVCGADMPEVFRGPQYHWGIADELASWARPAAWDNILFGLRLGDDPRIMVATTPKPRPFYVRLLKEPGTIVVHGSTYENRANLARKFFDKIIRRYEGTRLGRQELDGVLLEDVLGALWTSELIEQGRVTAPPQRLHEIKPGEKVEVDDLIRVVVGVDPPGSSEGAECGIIGAGISPRGEGYVLADRSVQGSPDTWGRAVVALYEELKADRVVAEVNFGGDMVEHVIRTIDPSISYRAVRASRGKAIRAEPIAALYEQQRIHHVGYLADLEQQMASWVPGEGDSPDRVDALVWSMHDLMVGAHVGPLRIGPTSSRESPWRP